ncbi:MAG: Holliday junction branch migration protein RuvA [Mollicutes bacterium]|jgi:Holliday junction DNA helicase RuvA|nr:Holliday junction branch migration protein RuvA [Mollicutes bacterium]
MYAYIKGIISEVNSNHIVVDNQGIGYLVYVANPYVYHLDDEVTVYLYSHIREDAYTLYGFKSLEEKELFLKLINVKGVGPKIALPMLATGSVSGIADAIDRENILYLTKFPKIGEKLARQIILDLKGKLVKSIDVKTYNYDELISVLENLGYKMADIKKVIAQVNQNEDIETQVKEALRLLLK